MAATLYVISMTLLWQQLLTSYRWHWYGSNSLRHIDDTDMTVTLCVISMTLIWELLFTSYRWQWFDSNSSRFDSNNDCQWTNCMWNFFLHLDLLQPGRIISNMRFTQVDTWIIILLYSCCLVYKSHTHKLIISMIIIACLTLPTLIQRWWYLLFVHCCTLRWGIASIYVQPWKVRR